MSHAHQKNLVVEAVSMALAALRNGGVVLHPTETCYGLAADIFSETAVEKIYSLKNMSSDKPVSIMVSSLDEGLKYGDFSEKALQLAKKYWPGPLTIIVPRRSFLPISINRGVATVGIRCPDHEMTQQLLKDFGGPLVTTSANRTGEPQAYDVETFLKGRHVGGIGGEDLPDEIIDAGRIPEIQPSTIVEVVGDEMRIVRQGPIVL